MTPILLNVIATGTQILADNDVAKSWQKTEI